MVDERRGARRAPISGVRVTYESAGGARVEAEVLDIAAGGLFIRTDAPMAVGKRLALDLTIVGEPGPWSALGRVVWTRAVADAAPAMAAGMAVKLIDVDDATIAVIARLVDDREPTAPGVGTTPKAQAAPVGGAAAQILAAPVGVAAQVQAAPVVGAAAQILAAPVGAGAPEREPTLVGVGIEPAPEAQGAALSREASIAIDLVAEKTASPPAPPVVRAPTPTPAPTARPRPSTPPPRGGGGARWVIVVMLVVVAGVAAYVLLDGFLRPLGP